MPMIMRSVDQIMDTAKRDMFFIRFGGDCLDIDGPSDPLPRAEHLAWFDAHGLSYEIAAPRGWLEGDPGCFAVHFAGLDDPLVAAYTGRFENEDGKSLNPDAYQMVYMTYQSWLDEGGPSRMKEDEEAEW